MLTDSKFNPNTSVFGGTDIVIEGVTLRDPNQYRDAIIYSHFMRMPVQKLKQFCVSEEAKILLNENIISQDMLDDFAQKCKQGDYPVDLQVCHTAKLNGDPLWDELVDARTKERRILNDLITKYANGDNIPSDIETGVIESCIPEYFR